MENRDQSFIDKMGGPGFVLSLLSVIVMAVALFVTFQGNLDSRLQTMQAENNRRFDTLQAENNRRFDALQAENNRQFDALQAENNRQFEEVSRRFDRVDQRLDQLFEVLRIFERRITRLEEQVGVGADPE